MGYFFSISPYKEYWFVILEPLELIHNSGQCSLDGQILLRSNTGLARIEFCGVPLSLLQLRSRFIPPFRQLLALIHASAHP